MTPEELMRRLLDIRQDAALSAERFPSAVMPFEVLHDLAYLGDISQRSLQLLRHYPQAGRNLPDYLNAVPRGYVP